LVPLLPLLKPEFINPSQEEVSMRLIKLLQILLLFILLSGAAAHGQGVSSPPSPAFGQEKTGAARADRSVAQALTAGYPWRGLLIGADHGGGDIHHDNIYIRINEGPILYQTTIPARKAGNQLPDAGLLWHFFTRDQTRITVYATSAFVSGTQSDLSDPFPLDFSYPVPATCTEETVPQAVAGEDQLVAVGTSVTLDGSLSYDPYTPDNQNLIYSWECYSAPESQVVLSDEGKNESTTFTPNQAGHYYFRFTIRDRVDSAAFNRSPVSYVRITAVADTADFISANPGRPQQVQVGETAVLDGSHSRSTNAIVSYTWTLENPMGPKDIENISGILGSSDCRGSCYLSNYDADDDVDGSDLAVLAANYSVPDLPGEEILDFVPAIARPHIFKLTIDDGLRTDSETTILSVHHENATPVLTPPDTDPACLDWSER